MIILKYGEIATTNAESEETLSIHNFPSPFSLVSLRACTASLHARGDSQRNPLRTPPKRRSATHGEADQTYAHAGR